MYILLLFSVVESISAVVILMLFPDLVLLRRRKEKKKEGVKISFFGKNYLVDSVLHEYACIYITCQEYMYVYV